MLQIDTNRFSSSRRASERSDGSRPGFSAAWKASMASWSVSPRMNRMA